MIYRQFWLIAQLYCRLEALRDDESERLVGHHGSSASEMGIGSDQGYIATGRGQAITHYLDSTEIYVLLE